MFFSKKRWFVEIRFMDGSRLAWSFGDKGEAEGCIERLMATRGKEVSSARLRRA